MSKYISRKARPKSPIQALSSGQSNLQTPMWGPSHQLDDRHRNPNINIRERSSGWATNYSNSSSSNINNSIEKRKKLLEKETLETEELPFLLQSGVLLCRFSLEGETFFNSCFIFEGSSTSSNLPMALPGPNSPQEHS